MIGERARQAVKGFAVLTVVGVVLGVLAVAYVLRPKDDAELLW